MNELAKIQHRMSEIRGLIADNKEMSDEDRDKHKKEYSELEVKFREELEKQAREAGMSVEVGPLEDAPAEVREFNELHQRASLGRFLDAIVDGKAVDGAEKEYRDAWFPDGVTRGEIEKAVPVAMFLPVGDEIHIRQDAPTVVTPAEGERVTRPIMARIFSRSDVAFLGGRFIGVSAGTQQFPYVSAGASLQYVAENEEVQSAIGTITVEESNPMEATLAYKYGMSSGLRFGGGALESTLRNDATMAIEDGIDRIAISGQAADGGANKPLIPGLMGPATGNARIPREGAAAGAVTTVADFLALYSSRVDGKYANTQQDVRLMARPEVYQKFAFEPVAPNADRFLSELFGPERWRSSEKIPAPAANVSDIITYAPLNDRGEFLIPTWENVQVITDPYTRAANREVIITFAIANNYIVLRSDPWERKSVKTA